MKQDADSLKQHRLKKVKRQPNTCRGQCILRHAKYASQPCLRYTIVAAIALTVFIHLLLFCITYSLIPILLLSIYPLIIIPLVIVCIAKDLIKKHEGFLTWHRNSVGDLLSRFTFAIFFMISVVVVKNCSSNDQTLECIKHSMISQVVVSACITLKIVCLHN
jgi:hypothetical protein